MSNQERDDPVGYGGPVASPPTHMPMPPEIALAVLDVMSKVKALEKDAMTTGGSKFKYTSVDQFFELLGPLMAAAGIFTLLHEVNAVIDQRTTTFDSGASKTSMWMTTDYEIWIYHKTGIAYGPVLRKIQVLASGPQSYGMGPSYVEKYFLRSLFKVPTGDDDADGQPKTGLPATRDNRDNVAAEAAARDYIEKCRAIWSGMKSQADLIAWWDKTVEERSARFTGKDDPLYKEFLAAYQDAGSKLPEKPAQTTAANDRQEARAFIAQSKAAWANMATQAQMAEWWRTEKAARDTHFTRKDDPLYVEFKTAFNEIGMKLPEGNPTITSGAATNGNKPPVENAARESIPKDDLPAFNGDGRPSESLIRMNFRSALVRCVARQDCNEAYLKEVEPWEKSLPKAFVDEMFAILNVRIKELEN